MPKVTVRMYNVGFGDAFLVLLPGKRRPYRILFDCGSIKAGPHSMQAAVDRIIADCTTGGEAAIDLVVATHRHKDHVEGFSRDGWERVQVGEVWMPWTEDPHDPQARMVRSGHARLAAALQQRFAAGSLEGVLAANAASNEAAMEVLHRGFAGDPVRRFLPEAGATAATLTVPTIPGVKFHVLGPPRDEAALRRMDPPKGQSYLALEAARATADRLEPFGPAWRADAGPPGRALLSENDRAVLEAVGEDDGTLAASGLDNAVNNTSLMVVVQVGRASLLFSGDAQFGAWEAALKVPKWRDLLAGTSFYKVGHHGSHNATPVEFVEQLLRPGARAMASTAPKWEHVPKQELLDALAARKVRVARSDRPQEAPKTFKAKDGFCIETQVAC